mmetsp:Transcript_11182/g.20931  ORF Transcript_11182/g.20931 Transcript_11182/m.20931 type:complete len:494 (+) Transcript_11182:2278-3759(+)
MGFEGMNHACNNLILIICSSLISIHGVIAESVRNGSMGENIRYKMEEHSILSSKLCKCSSGEERNVDDAVQENLLTHIKLHSSTWGFSIKDKDFSIPMKVMIDRENQYAIGDTSSESFILQKVKEHYHRDFIASEFLSQTLLDDWYSFLCELNVVIDLDDVISAWDVVDWNCYLAHDIRKYYVTGKISVFEQRLKEGYDVLYAFQCLDIPFDNRAVSYDSFVTVLRSENRLAYYYHREDIARWIAKKLKCASSKGNRIIAFLTSPSAMTRGCQIYIDEGDLKCEVLSMMADSGISHVHVRQAVVHDFLNEEHIDKDANYVFHLRSKFALFLENYLPGTNVSFRARKVIFVMDDPGKSFSSILPVLVVENVMQDSKDSQDLISENSTYPPSWLSSMFDLGNILSVDGFPCTCSDDYYEDDEEDTATTTTSTETSDDSFESIPLNNNKAAKQATKEIRTRRKRLSSVAIAGRRASPSSGTVDSMTAHWLVNVCLG